MPTIQRLSDPIRARVLGTLLGLSLCISLPGVALAQFGSRQPEPIEVAAAFPSPRPVGTTFNFPVKATVGGNLFIKFAPNPWRNSIVRVHLPIGDESAQLAAYDPKLFKLLGYMRGPLMLELRTGGDGSLEHNITNLPLGGLYQVDVLTATPTSETPGSELQVIPWSDVTQTLAPRTGYNFSTGVPGQQGVFSVPLKRGQSCVFTLITTHGSPPAVLYLFDPNGAIVWRHTVDRHDPNPLSFNLGGTNMLSRDGTYQMVVVWPPDQLASAEVVATY